jgi:hypothetical protein
MCGARMGADVEFSRLIDFRVAVTPPRQVATVSEGLRAVRSLPLPVRSAVHWRLAEALLSRAAKGQLDDYLLVRRVLLSAIAIESQLPPHTPNEDRLTEPNVPQNSLGRWRLEG